MNARRRLATTAAAAGLVLALGAGLALAHGNQATSPQWGGGYGNMHHMMMGPGMMGSGMMMGPGQGIMMGPGQGMMGPGYGQPAAARDLTLDDVRHVLAHRVAMFGLARLKVGDVTERDADTILAEIVTVDGSLIQRYEVNRHTGLFAPVE